MFTKIYRYRGRQISIDLFPKPNGEYAWAFKIGEGDTFGLEGARLPTEEEAVARAKAAAEARVDSLLAGH